MNVNFGKSGFDPGHYAGANVGPGTYREGDVMLRLGLKLQKTYGSYLTRTDGNDITLLSRAKLASAAGCRTLISLHTNAPEAAKDVLVIYSMLHPEHKEIAEYIGKEIAQAMGLKFREARTKRSDTNPNVDYYGMIRLPLQQGIKYPFIVEHGSHWQMAVDTEKKIDAIVECYGRLFGLKKADPTVEDYIGVLNKATPQIVGDVPKWINKAAADKDIYWLIRKSAEYVEAQK